MAATAPKMSAIGELPRVEAAPVFSGAPLDSVGVEEPVGREVPVPVVRERVALEMVLLPLTLEEMEPDAEVVAEETERALVVEPEAVEEADEAEAEEVASLPERAMGPM